MKKSKGTRLLSLLLAVVMLFSLLSVAAFAEEQETAETQESAVVSADEQTDALEETASETSNDAAVAAETGDDASVAEEEPGEPMETDPSEQPEPLVTDYATFLMDLEALEGYAEAYAREHAGEDPVALVINFVRTGVEKYAEGEWLTLCGPEVTAFTSYVMEHDADNDTHAMDLRSLGGFTLPNGNEVEFAHMFGCMDMSYHTKNRDTADLGSWLGDLCDLVQLSTNAGVSGTLDEMVETISTTPTLFLYDDPSRHSFGQMDLYADLDAFYLLSRLNGTNTLSEIMRSYYTPQLNDSFRATYFLNNRLGELQTRADIRMTVHEYYLANNAISVLEGKYVPEGVNSELRKACCYVFADYLFETAHDRIVNDYYTPFSTQRSMLAPGVTQEIKLARTADNKQLAYYIATADITRSDVHVFANYADNNGSEWRMQRVSEQVASAQARHSNPDDPEHYIENYNAVVGTNADFYNMSTGKVSGTLVMEGQVWGAAPQNSSYFFAILKDGTPVIDQNRKWSQYESNVQEAVGGGALLVKDGKVNITSTTNYYNDRASRTAVGITYDGQVILMVLDGRQEPWSCGGSAIEIAQIMLDAGCVVALNLDGGGSTTYVAKQEGSDTATVVNRPSDGYERSVSSSLLVVSTAKPSNVFDHAVVSADYDYLTVGTELEIHTHGVTVTGGAIDLPEGAALQLSDDSIGTLSGNMFTASALGDVTVKLVSAEGEVLGSKTLHVVEPTDLQFTRDTLNVVYGEPEPLPLEATYNGSVVKINPGDVVFGFVKVSLVPMADVDGQIVNTTKTELVFDYPEAGSMQGFNFVGNENGGLRTLTVGAVLMSKMPEFQQALTQIGYEAYVKAIQDGFSNDEAALISQEAAVTKGLELAASMKLYMYKADEAEFDFNDATGGDDLLAWKREVTNSNYRNDENTYYAVTADEDMTISYTFAVNMSKMPIPEKLTGLLHMLPGGDQEGRTAWQFLLQLAERISPLTYVKVTVDLPEGFDVDISNLKMVNEYFTLNPEDITLENNKLTIVARFIEQTEPISPTTANPLCVLSGLKLTPTDGAAWDENRLLDVELTGTLGYEIYAHFHALESFSRDPNNQEKYGLYPYSNRDYNPQDYGGYFNSNSDKPITFTDSYRLCDAVKDGWVRENSSWKYYDNGVVLTGLQYLRSYDSNESGLFWFDLGEDGTLKGKYTGFAQRDGKWYYPMDGVPTVGWYEIDGDNYYFKKDGSAQTEPLTVGPATYEFNDHGKVIHGCWVTTEKGTRYYYASNLYYHTHGGGATALFAEIDGNTYAFAPDGYRFENGYAVIRTGADENGERNFLLYYFGENGVCAGLQDQITGVVKLIDGNIIYAENAQKTYHGVYVEYFDADGNQIESKFGAAKAVYMYFGYDGNAAIDMDRQISKDNGLLEHGATYHFDENGQYVVDLSNVKNGIYEENGGKYYYEDNVLTRKGLFEYVDGCMYYAAGGGVIKTSAQYTATVPNTAVTGMPKQYYYFDPEGKLFVPEITMQAVVKSTGEVLKANCPGLKLSYGYPTEAPLAPSYLGYELIGWKVLGEHGTQSNVKMVDGNLTAANLNAAIAAVVKQCGYDPNTKVDVTAYYKKTADTYTVNLSYTMPDGTLVPNFTTEPRLVGDAIKLTTSETFVDGSKTYYFDHWLVGGEEYRSLDITLRPSQGGNYDATAVYAEQEYTATPMLAVTEAFAETINDIHKLGVSLTYSVPEGYEMQKVGFRVSTKDPTLQTTFSTSTSKLTTPDGSYTVHIKAAGKEDIEIYVCAYLTVKNLNTGETETILTDPVPYVWSAL